MIEINLIPDVKKELIKAQRVRTSVISGAIVLTLIAGAVVLLLALYVFGGQAVRDVIAENSIKTNYKKLSDTQDLSKFITIQNQLSKIATTHDEKLISSRTFDLLATIAPSAPNNITISKATVNSEEGTITIEAQASNGYLAYEAFKKTVLATKISYFEEGSSEVIRADLASDFVEGERGYGDDANGAKVLRFTATFTYNENLYTRSSQRLTIEGPERQNVTDSNVALPKSLFGTAATDSEGQ